MLYELLPLLPDRLTAAPTPVLVGAAVGGLLFGCFGARFSRAQFTLAAVAAGTLVGSRLPALFHWSIDPMCLGVAGAVILGTAGFLFHRTLVSLSLGAVLALWALTITWIARAGGAGWDPSALHWSGDAVAFLRQLWSSLPGDLGRLLPVFGGGAFAVGVFSGILWPRLSRCLLYSALGLTVTLLSSLILAARLRPDWLSLVAGSPAVQVGFLAAWTVVTLVLQWRFSRRFPKRQPSAQPPAKPHQSEQRLVAKQVVRVPSRQTRESPAARGNPFTPSGPAQPALNV